jgi:hypothetical protein
MMNNLSGVPHEEYVTIMEHSSLLDDPIVPTILKNLLAKAKGMKQEIK